jgi:hypothetical protein
MTAVDEKKTVVDNGSSDELEQGSSSAGYSEIDTKKLIRKIDLVLIPWLALLYLYDKHLFMRYVVCASR